MASASSKSAKTLFADSKMRLSERVQVNINNIASLSRQLQRGSKSSEVIFIFFSILFKLIYYSILFKYLICLFYKFSEL